MPVKVKIDGDAQSFENKLAGLGKIGSAALAAVGIAGVAAFGKFTSAAVEVGGNFEAAMSQVAATMGTTTDQITELSDLAKELGASTKFSATEAAEALNYLALAGYDAEKSMAVLPQVLNIAAAGEMDLAYASDLVTDSMAALGLGVEDLEGYTDQLAKTAQSSNTNVAQLGEAVLVAGGQARLAGMEVDEMNTALGLLANVGIKGSEGGTALRNSLKNLYTPTTQAAGAMKELGITTKDAQGNLLSTQDVLKQFSTRLDGLSEAARMDYMSKIFDTRTIAAANALINRSGEDWDTLQTKIQNSTGAATAMAETMIDNLQGDVTILKSALEGLGIAAFATFGDALRSVVQQASDAVSGLTAKLQEPAIKTALASIADGFASVASVAVDVLGGALTGVVNIFALLGSNIEGVTTAILIAAAAMSAYKVATQIIPSIQTTLAVATQAVAIGMTEEAFAAITAGNASTLLSVKQAALAIVNGILTGSLATVTLGFKALWAAMLTNPLGWLMAGVAALAGGMVALAVSMNKAGDRQKEVEESTRQIREGVDELKQSNDQLIESYSESSKAYSKNSAEIEANGRTTEELINKYKSLKETVDSNAAALTAAETAIDSTATVALELSKKERSLIGAQQELEAVTTQLTSTNADMASVLEDGSLSVSEQTKKLRELNDAQKDYNLAVAASERNTELIQEHAEAENALAAAKVRVDQNNEKIIENEKEIADTRAKLAQINEDYAQTVDSTNYAESGWHESIIELTGNITKLEAENVALGETNTEIEATYDDLSEAAKKLASEQAAQAEVERQQNQASLDSYKALLKGGNELTSGQISNIKQLLASGAKWDKGTQTLFDKEIKRVRALEVAEEAKLQAVQTGEERITRIEAEALETRRQNGDELTDIEQASLDAYKDILDQRVDAASTANKRLSESQNISLEEQTQNMQANTELTEQFIADQDFLRSQLPGMSKYINELTESDALEIRNSVATWGTGGRETAEAYFDAREQAANVGGGDLADSLDASMQTSVDATKATAATGGKEVGQELADSEAEGVEDGAPGVESAATSVIESVASIAQSAVSSGGFESVGVNISTGIAVGIRSGAGAIYDAVTAVVKVAVAAAKIAADINSPSRVFRDEVGRMIAHGIAAGIEAEKSVAEKEMESLINSVYSKAKNLIDDRKYYGQISLKSEKAALQEMARQFAGYADKVREINKEIYRVEQEILKARYDRYKSNVDARVNYEGISLEKQLKLWRKYIKNFKKSSDEYKAIQAEIKAIKQEIASTNLSNQISGIVDSEYKTTEQKIAALQKILKKRKSLKADEKAQIKQEIADLQQQKKKADFTSWLDGVLGSNKTYEQQIAALENRLKADKLSTLKGLTLAQIKEINDAIADLQNKVYEKTYENQISYIEARAEYEELSIKEQIKLYEKLAKTYQKDAAKRIEIEKKIIQLNIDAYRQAMSLEEEYQNQLTSRAEAISGYYGLFDRANDAEILDGEWLLEKLEGQVERLTEWTENIAAIEARGITGGLLEELQEFGVDANDELNALLALTDGQLQQYADLYAEKQRIANEQATKELSNLRDETDKQIAELLGTTVEALRKSSLAVGTELVNGIAQGVNDRTPYLMLQLEKLGTEMTNAIKASLDIKSPSQRLKREVGHQSVDGIIEGVEERTPDAVDAIEELAESMVDAIEIDTPSLKDQFLNLFRDVPAEFFGIGSNSARQFLSGFSGIAGELFASLENITLGGSALPAPVTGAPVGDVILNFYEPVETPDQFGKVIKRVFTYGLAGERN